MLLLAASALTALAVVALIAHDPPADEPAPDREQPFATTPLEGFDTLALTVARDAFCSRVDPREVEAALGAEPDGERGYDNGCLLYTSPSPRDGLLSRMPSSA